ncbi:hypothetical protein COCSUDRAFT_44434 [Coccomyxa subellipsoidea C-169]|uniref:HMG box domain-containing protein n=1 Tax=Coccomyxa subellipsoidea (strain C-169) TaxID=574566 RepID=I0YME7_COCSC|nr:hypothetical protein COCSUDRAFT_44434 [Coccomyxa subellipsoidea C-169]EIE19566.1 hypothetical protein COCSUDRAFT_44434 [Coccomyxa subellipsoidea C-169]|eukprot:XP_005644110.1 hypothetical protein COCSUDRAFT_44434 [Coccomyxa subellipsoidea C-169]
MGSCACAGQLWALILLLLQASCVDNLQSLIDEGGAYLAEDAAVTAVIVTRQDEHFVVKRAKSSETCENEAIILEHLAEQGAMGVPRCLGTSTFQRAKENEMHVIVLTYLGKQLPLDELKKPEVRKQLADVLTEVHCCGVVNGDLKPSHIRVDDKGRVSIADWDLGAFRTKTGGTKVHEWVKKGFQKDIYLKQLPHEHFWGVFEGTPTWAAPSTHLGYGPSVAGDFGSFGLICAAAISGKAPWSEPLVKRRLNQQIDHAVLSVLLTLGLPAVIQAKVHVSPSGCDGGIVWADFWAHQRALAVHAQSGVTEEQAAVAFAQYICGMGTSQVGAAHVAKVKRSYYGLHGQQIKGTAEETASGSSDLGIDEAVGEEADLLLKKELSLALDIDIPEKAQDHKFKLQEEMALGALRRSDDKGDITVAPDIFFPVKGISRVSIEDMLMGGDLNFEPVSLGARVQVDTGALKASEHPGEIELTQLIGEVVVTKNPLSVLNKIGQLEVALYAAGAKADPAQRHPLDAFVRSESERAKLLFARKETSLAFNTVAGDMARLEDKVDALVSIVQGLAQDFQDMRGTTTGAQSSPPAPAPATAPSAPSPVPSATPSALPSGSPSHRSGKKLRKPRRRSAYDIFRQQRGPAILDEHGPAPFPERAKILGRAWKALSDAEKRRYEG